jgi:hypothetical protein
VLLLVVVCAVVYISLSKAVRSGTCSSGGATHSSDHSSSVCMHTRVLDVVVCLLYATGYTVQVAVKGEGESTVHACVRETPLLLVVCASVQ